MITGFVETAKGAVKAGFDGFEIHNAHGCLASQFLSLLECMRRLNNNPFYKGLALTL